LLARQRLVELVAGRAQALAHTVRGLVPVALAHHRLAGLVALARLAPAHDRRGAHVDLEPALAARALDLDLLRVHGVTALSAGAAARGSAGRAPSGGCRGPGPGRRSARA